MESKVKITAVKATANGTHQLTLEQVIEDPNNVVGFFMAGHKNVASNERKRITWQTVSEQQFKAFGFKEGDILDDVIKKTCRIQIVETTVARTWKDATGKIQVQQPKINPSTKEVLKHKGEPIYRSSRIVFNNAPDVPLAHDVIPVFTEVLQAEDTRIDNVV